MYFLNFHFLYGRSFQIYLVKKKKTEKSEGVMGVK